MDTSNTGVDLPLAGIRVLDFSQFLAGPVAALATRRPRRHRSQDRTTCRAATSDATSRSPVAGSTATPSPSTP